MPYMVTHKIKFSDSRSYDLRLIERFNEITRLGRNELYAPTLKRLTRERSLVFGYKTTRMPIIDDSYYDELEDLIFSVMRFENDDFSYDVELARVS